MSRIIKVLVYSPVLQGGVNLELGNSFGGIFESVAKNRDKMEIFDKQSVVKK